MPFYPGPGLGGHCIPVDPFYLSWKARQTGFESRFIELAGEVNGKMPRFVVDRVVDALNSASKPVRGSRIHMFGMAYKPNVGDARESPAIDIAQLLLRKGAIISYSDPYVPRMHHADLDLEAVSFEDALKAGVDCAVITTNHRDFDYQRIVAKMPLVVDTRNVLKGMAGDHIFRL
jgi:UDP-N-acetyl-D-glucosamine dehydrogenase